MYICCAFGPPLIASRPGALWPWAIARSREPVVVVLRGLAPATA